MDTKTIRCLPDFTSPITKLLHKKQFRKTEGNANCQIESDVSLPHACTYFSLKSLQ